MKYAEKESLFFRASYFRLQKGFTLIELLLVIFIIALLVSVILVVTSSTRAKARDARRQSDIRQINLAMEMCFGDAACGLGANEYPVHAAGVNTWTTIDSDGVPNYLTVPVDPKNSPGQQYTWTAGDQKYYCLYVKLESITDTWFCASNKGVLKKTQASYAPSNLDCCGRDVTQ